MLKYRLGIDIGGTFTDLNLIDNDGKVVDTFKVATTPKDPVQGILNGLDILFKKGIAPEDIDYFVHGTTIGLNTLLQRVGSELALFVTDGFRDLLNLQRLRLPVPYDFRSRLTESLIPRERVFEVKERLLYDGSVHKKLNMDSLDAAIDKAVKCGVKGVVVCFLYSYKNDMHEEMACKRIAERAPELNVCGSSALWPQTREYERCVVATVNLYIQEKVKKYFQQLESGLRKAGLKALPFITQSNGGIMDMERAANEPIKTLFSGPASGIIGAAHIARSADKANLITIDVGGTSADISVIEDGKPMFTQSSETGGLPILIPTISIDAIGAGGGSIAWIDSGGLLKIGPVSVGSDPGPACYGWGNETKPALSDAFLLCGYLNPKRFAGGRLPLYPELSEKVIKELSKYLKLDTLNTADRIVQVAVTKMYSEINSILEQKGIDPRDFSLLAFGGAGSVVGNFLAEELHIGSVLVPPTPGTLCALGALNADFLNDVVSSEHSLLRSIPMDELRAKFAGMNAKAEKWIKEQNIDKYIEKTQYLLSMDVRYHGQSYETEMIIEPAWLKCETHAEIEKAFHDMHKRYYGHCDTNAEVEVVNLKVRALGITHKPPYALAEEAKEPAKSETTRRVILKGKVYTADIYSRTDLKFGHCISGPAVVEQDDSTTIILDGWEGKINRCGNLIITRKESIKG
ncbi:hydantoinase/oxoprolinase family protein [Synergistes jonesii]|uniref:Hydantoin utilization protein A n=1 Tax=Synergistes jonesii TaxID=2754 RepID=A0A073IT27_9BACT|nr:hydantoinase/oxoprolinase family protein [Synergistes jonesii]KEJ93488.1 hydantoin utilization protein A [Synergistes jonesii]OFB61447.1 hydantoin utilization protein A [Synergistes jonesii]OFB65275.1 hydantoin utilization protein A [Synergistes jonesii]OFB68625.1 hydantoin utilization protein A [Synergistes jonesii]OFB69291.1 hydantoin utilization protein A [Synergistes jonesii]